MATLKVIQDQQPHIPDADAKAVQIARVKEIVRKVVVDAVRQALEHPRINRELP